jgi:hypothetical protein
MLDEDGLGNYGTDAAATCKSGNGGEKVDEKDREIAHICIVARNGKLAEFRANWQLAKDRNTTPTFQISHIWQTEPVPKCGTRCEIIVHHG